MHGVEHHMQLRPEHGSEPGQQGPSTLCLPARSHFFSSAGIDCCVSNHSVQPIDGSSKLLHILSSVQGVCKELLCLVSPRLPISS